MDDHTFRQLALAELDAVYRPALHLAGNSDEAQDLVRETYARALTGQSGFELRQHGIRPWLYRIPHNCFYTRWGRQRRRGPDPPPACHRPSLSDLSRAAP